MTKSLLRFLHFFLLAIPVLLYAQTPVGKDAVLHIRHTDVDFEISGSGQNPAWEATDWVLLEQRTGSQAYATKIKLLYSDSGIYMLFSCEDQKITATYASDFSPLFKEDVVEAFLWPDETIPVYFEYELSPLNYELPILVPNIEGKRTSLWEPWNYQGARKVRHATRIMKNREGNSSAADWTAEFFIPYVLLEPLRNVPPQKGTHWRVNMYRIDYDQGMATWAWQPTRINFHDYERFGTISFD